MDKALEAGYRCPICKTHDAVAYQRCSDPRCPDGRDPRPTPAALPATNTSGLVERLRAEAQTWKLEAMAHKSSLHEAYQACTDASGEPGNWNGAEPIKAKIAALTARAEKAEARLAEAEAVIQPFAEAATMLSDKWEDHETHWPLKITDAISVGCLRAARSYLEGRK